MLNKVLISIKKAGEAEMENTKQTLKEKMGDRLIKIKTYWKKPPKGYDVSYREFLDLSLGFGGLSFLSILVQWTTLATSVHMMISYFKVSTGLIWVLGIIASLIALIRSPILSMIIDNSNSKKGKFKPFLVWTVVLSSICFGLIPYIPSAWNSVTVMSFNLPAIPIMGVTDASTITLSLAILIMFVMLQAGIFIHTLLNQAMAGIEQTISTVSQERANIGSIKGLICNIPSSVINVILPILAGTLFANVGSGGWNSIEMYRTIFPFCAMGALGCIFFTVKGTKERVVVNKKYIAKVKFFEGAKELSKNKYFWIITLFNVAVGIRILCNITTWITQYSFVSDSAKTLVGLYCTTLLMNVLILGMIFGPILIRKYGKRNVLFFSNIGFTVMVFFQFLVYKSPVLILVAALFQNAFGGLCFIATIMVSDVLDYQQWKTGKRLEGFWQNYSSFITTLITIFTGMLAPLFLSFGGIKFSDDISVALQNIELRNGVYKYQTLLALIGSIIAMIPMFFYDLTEKKHGNYVRALKIRVAIDNYYDGDLQDIDVINLKEIVDYAYENNDEFVLDEISKHNDIKAITSQYDEVLVRTEINKKREEAAEISRNIELEEKKLHIKLDKAKTKAAKIGVFLDEQQFIADYKSKSIYLNKTKNDK